MSVKESFDANVGIRLGDERKVSFWKDRWAGDSTLVGQSLFYLHVLEIG